MWAGAGWWAFFVSTWSLVIGASVSSGLGIGNARWGEWRRGVVYAVLVVFCYIRQFQNGRSGLRVCCAFFDVEITWLRQTTSRVEGSRPSMMQGPPELAGAFQFVIDLKKGSYRKIMPTIPSRSS